MLHTTGTIKKKSVGLQLELDTASSCSGCKMQNNCTQHIDINNSNFIVDDNIQENDKLTLSVSNQLFFRYISLIYALPLLIFIATIWFGSYYNMSELKIMGLSIVNLAIFFLHVKYSKILDKFHNSVTHQKQTSSTTTSWNCNLFH